MPRRAPRGCRGRVRRATAPAGRRRPGVRRRGRASRTGSRGAPRVGGSSASVRRIARCHGAADAVWLPTSKVNPATRSPTCRQWATSAAASSGATPKLGELGRPSGGTPAGRARRRGQAAELRDLRGAVDDERADAPQVRARDVGDRHDGVVVQAARDRDAGALEKVDLAAGGDGEARPERVDRAGSRRGGGAPSVAKWMATSGSSWRRASSCVVTRSVSSTRSGLPCSRTRPSRSMRVGVVGEVATNELAVRCTIGGRRDAVVVALRHRVPRSRGGGTFGEVRRRASARASDAEIAAQHVHERAERGDRATSMGSPEFVEGVH